jgi:hypothetical protein
MGDEKQGVFYGSADEGNAVSEYEVVHCVRPIDIQNAECRADYEYRRIQRINYPDLRGDITGPLFDQDYANKVRVAKALLQDIKIEKVLKNFPNKVIRAKFARVR